MFASYPSPKWFASFAAAAGLLLAGGCGGPEDEESKAPPAPGEVILAEVAGTVITPEDLQEEAERRIARRQPVPDKETLLEQMVERRAMLHRAKELGLDRDAEVTRAIENLLIGKLKETALDDNVREAQIDDDSLREIYAERIEEFTQPAKYRLAILYLEGGENASAAKRAELRSRLEEARDLALSDPPKGGRGPAAGGFGELAVRYSDDQVGRYRGGDAGWFDQSAENSRWPAEVLETGAALAKDAVSDIIETEDGLYLVKKTDERPSAVKPFAAVRMLLQQRELVKRRENLADGFRAEALKGAGAKVHSKALASVDLPGAPSSLARESEDEKPPSLPGLGR